MTYDILKIIHIISASLLFGSMVITPVYHMAYRYSHHVTGIKTRGNLLAIVGLISLIIQPVTGFAIIAIKHYSARAFWVMGALLCFLLLGCIFLAAIYLQQRSLHTAKDMKKCKDYLFYQMIVLLSSLPLFVAMYYFMVERPGS